MSKWEYWLRDIYILREKWAVSIVVVRCIRIAKTPVRFWYSPLLSYGKKFLELQNAKRKLTDEV